ncbi:carbohydrate deacetylase [Jiangella endophytica]|uniref:carbohydrate deacetylase n=1 Tax=Jiangella endophytica TaxID=1623398 RepID=UPI0018E597B6|nr:ChbG/HpnK family deacetylase [Jiangella endophytica]
MPAEGAETLGFAPSERVLIVNCDDLGMHPAVTAGIVDAVENGIAGSASLMVSAPGAADAMRLLSDRPWLPFGVHLTIIRDADDSAWGPVAARERVPSLLDTATGELFTNTPAGRDRLLARARLDEVERELRAQLDAVLREGLAPTHLDWHCLADGGRADVFELGLALAAEHGLAVRAWLDDGRAAARVQGRPVVDHAFVDSFALDPDDKAATYERLLRDLPAGLSEWAVHPALATPEWRAIEPAGWQVRATDHAFLTSARAREVLAEEGITVIDYRPLRPS